MIGPILLAVSWLLLRLEGASLGAIGFNRPRLRAAQFGAGFVVAGIVVALQQVGASLATGVPWQVNPDANLASLVDGMRWNVNSVLYEELVFRGYLLYQAIRWLGMRTAVLLDAIAFGIYHWFSYGVFGQPVVMGFILLYTGAFGLMLAFAFAKTRSVAAPIGLHLGWNMVLNVGFSSGPLGVGLLVAGDGTAKIQASGVPGLLLGIGLPLLLVIAVCTHLQRAPQKDHVNKAA